MLINTKNLILKKFKSSMISDNYLKALNDKSIIGLTEARHQNWNKENAAQYIDETANSKNSIMFAVLLKQSNKQIGNIRLFNINSIHKRAELSLLFYEKSEWGKGYATEGVSAVVDYAFKEMNLHRIYADYYSKNLGSSKMFKKVGFNVEGTFRDHFILEDNSFVDSIRIAIINSNNV